MNPRQQQKHSQKFATTADISRDSQSEALYQLIEESEPKTFPSVVGEALRSLNQNLRLLSDASVSLPEKDQCAVLGALDRAVFSLRLAADEMEANRNPNALLVSVLAKDAEARVDAEALSMLRAFRNAN